MADTGGRGLCCDTSQHIEHDGDFAVELLQEVLPLSVHPPIFAKGGAAQCMHPFQQYRASFPEAREKRLSKVEGRYPCQMRLQQ